MKFENASPLFADRIASIDTRRLRRMGLFDRSPNALIVDCQVVSAEAPEMQVQATWEAEARRVILALPADSAAAPQAVSVGRRPRAQGGGYYFLCPIGGERCEKLYYSEGRWGGRRAKRLSYSSRSGSMSDRYGYTLVRLTALIENADGRPPLAPERRARIEARIAGIRAKLDALPRRRTQRVYPDPRRYADLLDLPETTGKATQLAVLIDRSLSAEKAIERAEARAVEDDDAIGWLFRRGEALKASVQPAPSPEIPPGLAPDFVENYPRISVRDLAGRGLLRPGARRGVRLDWTGLGRGIDRCNLMLDLRDEALWFAGFEIFSDGQVSYQALALARAGGGTRFVCPLSGALTETIAYRAGRFAAPQPLRMTRRAGRG